MDFKELYKTKKYDFLRDNPRLNNRIILLGVTGSYGYGTEREGSDVDFRGITLELPSDIIGFTEFEQFEEHETDTVIYGFNKIIKLLLDCNPNTIEILGIDEDKYVIKNDIGQSLLDNKDMFLTKRAAASFGHYADAQLRRLQNAIARDSMTQPDREEHIIRSVSHALDDYNRRNVSSDSGVTKLYIDDAVTEDLEKEKDNVFNSGKYNLMLQINKKNVIRLTLPMLDYFEDLKNGVIETNMDPQLTHGIEKLKAMLLSKANIDDYGIQLCMMTNTGEPELMSIDIEDGMLMVR